MIIIRKVFDCEIESLICFYKEYIESSNYMESEFIVAFVNSKSLGFAQIVLDESIAEIRMLYVNPDARQQGMGDGILRTTLNYLEKQGYRWVMVRNNDNLKDFFIKKGFKSLDSSNILLELGSIPSNYQNSESYYCNIPDFFEKGCKKR